MLGTMTRLILVCLVAAVAIGAIALATWDVPPPSAERVTELPKERFVR